MGLGRIRTAGIAGAVIVSLAMAQQPRTEDENRDANVKAYVELLRKDVRKEKVAILAELMNLTPDESSKFWPLYNDYDKALTVVADERMALIRMYVENYSNLADPMAAKLANGVLDLETKRIQLKRQYLQKMGGVLDAKLALRFLQIESQLEKVIDLQIASSLPIVE